MAITGYTVESMAYLTSGMVDRGEDCSLEAAMCKVLYPCQTQAYSWFIVHVVIIIQHVIIQHVIIQHFHIQATKTHQ